MGQPNWADVWGFPNVVPNRKQARPHLGGCLIYKVSLLVNTNTNQMTEPQPTRKRTREEFESLVDETRVLVEQADEFWDGVRDAALPDPKKLLGVEMPWEGWEALCEVWAYCKDVLKDVHDKMSDDAEWAKRMEQVQKDLQKEREKGLQTRRELRECLAKERSKRIAMELFLHDTYKKISDVIPSMTKNPKEYPQEYPQ